MFAADVVHLESDRAFEVELARSCKTIKVGKEHTAAEAIRAGRRLHSRVLRTRRLWNLLDACSEWYARSPRQISYRPGARPERPVYAMLLAFKDTETGARYLDERPPKEPAASLKSTHWRRATPLLRVMDMFSDAGARPAPPGAAPGCPQCYYFNYVFDVYTSKTYNLSLYTR